MSANSSGVKLTRNNIDEVLFFRSDDGLLCVCEWCSKSLSASWGPLLRIVYLAMTTAQLLQLFFIFFSRETVKE